MCLLSVPLHIKCFRYNFVRASTKAMRMSPGVTTRGVGLRRISSCRWRITSRWVTLVLWWWVAIGLPVCRWRWVSNWWRNWLIHSRHLLSRRNCHRLWSEFAISFVHFDLMLCLHCSTVVIYLRWEKKEDLGVRLKTLPQAKESPYKIWWVLAQLIEQSYYNDYDLKPSKVYCWLSSEVWNLMKTVKQINNKIQKSCGRKKQVKKWSVCL